MISTLTRIARPALYLIVLGLAACGGNSSPPATYSVGGTVDGLLPGNSVTLTDNGKDTLAVSANGQFAFKSMLPDAANYSVTLTAAAPVEQSCTVSGGTGTVHAANVTSLKVTCAAKELVAGQVEILAGEVQAISVAGQLRPLHEGDSIDEGDTLRSGAKATAKIKMGDGGLITMRSDTEFKIDTYKFTGQQDGTERSFFSLAKGGFRSVTGLVGKLHKENYRIKTPTATLGIRGTDHEVYLVIAGSDAAKYSPVGMYDTVYSGATTLTNDKGTVVIEPKQMGYVAAPDEKPKLKPVDKKLFVPEPAAPKPAAPAPPPPVKPVATAPPPPAAAPAPVVAQPVKVEYPFDGRWSTELVCDDAKDNKGEFVQGFTWNFDTTIDHGKLNGQRGQIGQPGSGTFTGEVGEDGKVSVDVNGLIGKPQFSLGKRASGSPFHFTSVGSFSGTTGHATRTTLRHCELTFHKK